LIDFTGMLTPSSAGRSVANRLIQPGRSVTFRAEEQQFIDRQDPAEIWGSTKFNQLWVPAAGFER